MKINHSIGLLILLCTVTHIRPSPFMASQPYTIQKKRTFPWTAFFRSLFARDKLALGEYPIKAVFEGYVLYEPFWDSRQIIASASGLRFFAPKRKRLDPCGEDINNVGEINASVLETRMRTKLYGPEVLGAESFGLIEVDYVGSGLLISRLRDRHAYLKLTWKDEHMTFLAGQFYHPLRLSHLDLDPKVLSRNRGAPIHPSIRDPQLRFTKGWSNNLNLVLTALAQLRPRSLGPEGFSTEYTRRSLMPIMNMQLWLGPFSTEHVFGVGLDVKRLVPRLQTDECISTRASLTSTTFTTFAKLTAEPLSVRTQFIWTQNGTDYAMLGGYAVSSRDPCTDERSYTNINVMSYWIDFNLDKKISPGLFGGLSKNLGTGSPIIPSITNQATGEQTSLVFAVGPDIKYMVKVMPRIRVHLKPIVFGAELEWTRAGYGTLKPSGKIENVVPVSNIRLLLTSFFFF